MKKVAALLLLALAALTLVACGGDDDGDTTAAPAETTAEPTTGGGSEGGGKGSVVTIEAASGTDLAYVQKEVTAKAGDATIEFINPQSLSHDVVVEDSSGKELGGTDLIADSSTSTTITGLKPGTDTFYCSVPGHREAGMEGTFTVE